MAKANNKTTENNDSVAAFVKKITDPDRRKDCQAIIDIMEKQSGFPAKMWGPAIIGFGTYHYVYESGREGDAPLVGFSPRKTEFALYLSSEFDKRDELLKQFGKHKTAKACVYVKKLEDVKVDVLKKMISNSIKHTKAKYK
ncbi:MAG: DUF1801 domain-containing protein [Ferruginibacter sp.]